MLKRAPNNTVTCKEEWRLIPGFEKYMISSCGRLKRVSGRIGAMVERIMKYGKFVNGKYWRANLSVKGKIYGDYPMTTSKIKGIETPFFGYNGRYYFNTYSRQNSQLDYRLNICPSNSRFATEREN